MMAWAFLGALALLVVVFFWLKRMIDGAPTEPEQRDTWIDIPLDELGPQPFVDAVETPPVPKEKTVAPHCHRCGATMVLSPRKVCWMCSCTSSTPDDRSAA